MNFELHKPHRIRVRQFVARSKNMFREFIAVPLAQTHKGVFLYGRGSTKDHTSCMMCGRALTNEISRHLGIGPICGSHGYDLELTQENREELRKRIRATKVDGWFPKSAIEWAKPTDETIRVPDDHIMLKSKSDATKERGAHAELDDDLIRIHFPYDKAMIARVKTLHKRKYEKLPQPHWTAPFSIRTVQQLREWGVDIGAKLQKQLGQTEIARTAEEVAKHLTIDGLGGELYPFQHDGVAFIESRGGRAMVADEMGLGKTMQALAYLQLHEGLRPAVVICPAVVKENWRREAEKWMPGAIVHVISGKPTGQPLPPADLYVINYDIVSEQTAKPCPACKGGGSIKWAGDKKECPACKGSGDDPDKKKIIFRCDVTDTNPKIAVIDECHYIKNRHAQRTKAVLDLRKRVDHRIALSGTPIINKPVEFFNALRFIAPERFTSFWNFAQEYCGAVHNGYGWDFSGASNTKGLHDLLTSTIMIRRTKAEVLKDLPAKVRSVIPIPMANIKQYNAEEEAFKRDLEYVFGEDDEEIESKGGAEALVRIEKLKQEAVRQKLPSAIQWIRDYLEN